ncbi:DUF748 domain-containing protein [Arcobacter sp.]|uniref:DUF748 domain-containing protein n=1 Tax=Arcobacter sp. TaxID=1872629 RepID=UPI003D0BDFCD
MKNNLFIKILLSIFVIYSLVGFFIIPYIAKDQIIKNLDNLLIYKSNLKKVSFNPYTLKVQIKEFSISNKNEKLIAFDKLEIDFSLLKSIYESHISFKKLNLIKPYVNIVQDENENINLASILKPQENKKEKQTNEKATIPSFKITKTQIIDGNFLFTQIFNSKKTTTNINNFNYTFYDVGTFKNSLASHSLVTNINKYTKLYINGGLRLNPFKMDGKIKLKNLKPKEYIGYTKKLLDFNINEPTINLTLGYDINTKDGLKLYINTANLDLKDLKLLKDDNKFSIDTLKIVLNDLNIDDKSLKLSSVNIDNPIGSIVLEKKEDKVKKEKTTTSISDDTTKEKSNFFLDIGPVNINNAQIAFQDNNLNIPFKTKITNLNGSFSKLNSKASKPAELNVEGKVDEYGYTRITGLIDSQNIQNLTDINLIFKNININNLTPYSGKFVGRELNSGKLNLNLKYNITQSNLKAQNNIIINNIKLGKVVKSSEAANLPLDVAIALLEDSNGVIDINLPINGNINDPNFSVTSIVWKSFVNLILKAVTSPFSLLSSILGITTDEIKSLDFIYGESKLLDSEKETLDNIAKIFQKRPNLALKIEPSYNIKKDKEAIQKLKIEMKLETLTLNRINSIKEYLLKKHAIQEDKILISDEIKEIDDKDAKFDKFILGIDIKKK